MHFDWTPELEDNDYRMRLEITVPMTTPFDDISRIDAGVTHRIDTDGRVIDSAEATLGNNGLWFNVGETYDNATKTLGVYVAASGDNPLAPGPQIDYVFEFSINTLTGDVSLVRGHHDAFPAYEIWIKEMGDNSFAFEYGYMPPDTWWESVGLFGAYPDVQVTGPGLNFP